MDDINESLAKADAAELVEAGIGTIGTDESVFNRYTKKERRVLGEYLM